MLIDSLNIAKSENQVHVGRDNFIALFSSYRRIKNVFMKLEVSSVHYTSTFNVQVGEFALVVETGGQSGERDPRRV